MAGNPDSALRLREQKQLENARLALDSGHLDYAIDVCADLLKENPGSLRGWRLQRVALLRRSQASNQLMAKLRGWIMILAGFRAARAEPMELIVFVGAVLTTDPTNLWALRALAAAASKLGWLEITVFALEEVRELRPDDLENTLALGTALLAIGRYEDALKVADRALKSLPLDARAQDLMRRASIEQAERSGGWTTDAAPETSNKANTASRPSPGSPTAQIVTPGDWTQRLIDDALARLAEQPDNLGHYVSLVNGYRRLGRWDQALDWILKARARKVPGADVALEEHEAELRALLLEHRYKEAESMLARSQDDVELQARCAAARDAWLTFRISETRRALERSPADFIVRQTLAGLYLEKGDIDSAITEFQQNENVPGARISALVGLGRAFKRKKRFDDAIERFTAAKHELVVMDDVKKDVIYELGGCLLLKGEIDAAMTEFKSIHDGEEFISPEIAAKLAGAFTRTEA